MNNTEKSISVVIPAFNEEDRIGEVVRSTRKYVDEVIVVDDNSADRTAREAQQAGAKVISNPENLGYIQSIKKGFREASGDIIITMDADGEHNPEDIPYLLNPLINGKADLVLGKREEIARISERFLNFLTQTKVKVSDSGTGFRALKKDLAVELKLSGKCTCGIFVLEASKHGASIIEVPISIVDINKKRKTAWYHFWQFFYVVNLILKR